MIFANGRLLPDSQLSQVLEELEEAVNETRACRTLEPETVISALQAVGGAAGPGESWTRSSSGTPVPAGAGRWRTSAPCSGGRPWNTSWPWSWASRSTPFRSGPSAAPRPFPLGTLFHVTAGNVDGLPAFSAVGGPAHRQYQSGEAALRGPGALPGRLSAADGQEPRLAPFLYAFQIPSRDTAALRRLADLADGAVVWGGDGAVTALRQLALPGCKLMEWGHRLSFAYLSRWEGEEDALSALAEHLIQTGGLLCPSCQVIFLDTDALGGGGGLLPELCPPAGAGSGPLPCCPLGRRGRGACTLGRPGWSTPPTGCPAPCFPAGAAPSPCGRDRELELSPLHGNVLVKCLPQKALLPVLRRQKGRLQTAGLLCPAQDRPALTQLLARAGVTRIAPPGSMSTLSPGRDTTGNSPCGGTSGRWTSRSRPRTAPSDC